MGGVNFWWIATIIYCKRINFQGDGFTKKINLNFMCKLHIAVYNNQGYQGTYHLAPNHEARIPFSVEAVSMYSIDLLYFIFSSIVTAIHSSCKLFVTASILYYTIIILYVGPGTIMRC